MNETSSFFAIISRMKYIDRWALMRNTDRESISVHSLDTAMIAYTLAVLKNNNYGGNVNAERAAVLAMFHDIPEVITGDMPTPIKYFNDDIRNAYAAVEAAAEQTLIDMLPESLRDEFAPLISHTNEDSELLLIVKCADRLSALIKCIEELKAGNKEFEAARISTEKSVRDMNLSEGIEFLEKFIPPFELPLDKQ